MILKRKSLLILLAVVLSLPSIGQVNCLQFNFIDVTLDPLNPEVVLVDFENPSFQPVVDPGFKVFNGMTEMFLGSETVAYPVLGFESTHRVYIGSSLDLNSPQQLIFELWRNEYDSLLCGFEWIGILNNTPDCFQSQLTVIPEDEGSMQDALTITIREFETNAIIVDEFSLQLGTAPTQLPPLCLDRGCYTLEVTMNNPAVGAYTINLFEELYLEYFLVDIAPGFTEYSGQFEIWEGCPVAVAEQVKPNVSITPSLSVDGYFKVNTSLEIERVEVYSLEGKKLRSVESASAVQELPNGFYLVVVTLQDGRVVSERLIVQHA